MVNVMKLKVPQSVIVGISGKRGSGKDTAADYLVKRYRFEKFSFASTLKGMLSRDFQVPLEWMHDPARKEQLLENVPGWTLRKLMIHYGRFYREVDPLFWVKKTFEAISEREKCNVTTGVPLRVVVPDLRYINELKYIESQGGKCIRLWRRPDLNIYGGGDINDLSEIELDNYKDFAMVVGEEENVTPQDLYGAMDRFMSHIGVSLTKDPV